MPGAQRHVLVTGAGGFIGSALARRLRADGHDVIGVDLPAAAARAGGGDGRIEDRTGDRDAPCLGHDLTAAPLPPDVLAGVSLVFHAAALAGVQASWEAPADYWRVNAGATARLAAACRPLRHPPHVIHISSISVYGAGLHLDESMPPSPVSPYGDSKLAAERAWADYKRVRIVRLSNVYGPGQRADMAYAKFIHAVLSGGGIVLRDGGRQLRTPTYIDDCVEGIVLALKNGTDGGVYNVAGPDDVRLSDVPRELSRLLGRPVPAAAAPAGRGDPRVATVSIARAQSELGYAPSIHLREGLARQLAAAGRDVDGLARVADA